MIKTIEFKDEKVVMIDQTKLPLLEEYVYCTNYKEVSIAIKDMIIRGAPAIGVAAAFGVYLGARDISTDTFDSFNSQMGEVCDHLAASRPTAVNLFWAIRRMKAVIDKNKSSDVATIKEVLKQEAIRVLDEDIKINKTMGSFGNEVIEKGDTILTHCNAGALATAGYGTALGVIRAAHSAGKDIKVLADETRPFLQGTRLTAWELNKEEIPVKIITDNMAGYLMKKGLINKVVVGADRIASNGDAANKIGTYTVAVLAKENNIPFYVAAPTSTLDMTLATGDEIPIEERPSDEVTHLNGQRIAPIGVEVMNPAFDVTPNKFIAGIITEKGIAKAPFTESLKNLFK